jgi:hypothetical protein
MKDAFGKELEVGSKVLYSTGGGYGTVYHIGEILRLLPAKVTTPDKVEIKVVESSCGLKLAKNPMVYAANVVLTGGL